MEKISIGKKFHTGFGLATNVYKRVMEGGEISVKELIAWAAGRGFSWVELRDPNVEMTREQLVDIREFCEKLNIRVHYGWNNPDLLQEQEMFRRGMENATVFGPDTCCRVLVAPVAVAGRKGFSREEMDILVPRIREYTEDAKKRGLYLCFENDREPLFGDGEAFFAMDELMEACPLMCVAYDPANASRNTCGAMADEADMLRFYEKYSDRIFYVHLKVSGNHELLDTVELEGDFSVVNLVKSFSGNPDMWICLEIPRQADLVTMNAATERSLDVIKTIEELI